MGQDWLDRHSSVQTCYATLSVTLGYANQPQLRQLVLALGDCYHWRALSLIAIATIDVGQTSS